MYKYSVLMSVYYKENPLYLQQSIQSMLQQTVPPQEIVIVEDGKLTDELEEVIRVYTETYEDIFTIVKLDVNSGLGNALNAGLAICRNELVARMDSDDIALPKRCEMQLNAFDNDSELDIVGTQINEFVDDEDNLVSARVVPCKYESIIDFSKRRSPFNHPTVMYRKSVVLKCGGYSKEYKRKEDLDLFLNMLMNGCKAINLEDALLLYRTSIENLQRRKTWNNCYESISVMNKYMKLRYINCFDFMYVLLGQIVMFISPCKMTDFLSKKILRTPPL